jgi:GPH family glycoside/pentoside/hexuronide:cation symporter
MSVGTLDSSTSVATPRHVMAALAAPSLVLSAFTLPLAVYLPSHYTGYLGLDLAAVGTAFMIVRLLDIGVDPFLGFLMDRTRTPIGRYRPWLLLGAPLIMLSIGMLFMAQKGVGIPYLMIWLLVAYGGWSVLGLAQLSLSANVTSGYHERSRMFGWWQAAFMTGMIAAMLLPKIVAMMGMTSPIQAMSAMAWFVIGMTPIAVLPAAIFVKERQRIVDPKGGNWQSYVALMRMSIVRRLLAMEAMLGLAAGGTSVLLIFFFTQVKGLAFSDAGILLIGNAIAGLAATPIWAWLANRIGKHRALAVSAIFYIFAHGSLYFGPYGNVWGLTAIMMVGGTVYGATSMLPRSMLADVGDHIMLETGTDQTGLLYALLTGTWKIGQALAVGIMFWALERIGFNPVTGAANPPSAILGLELLFLGVPALLSLLAVPVILRYPLTAARHAEIRAALDARAQEAG